MDPFLPANVTEVLKPKPKRQAPKAFTAKAIAQYISEATGNCAELVEFHLAVLRGDTIALGTDNPPTLKDRLESAKWLADRALGKAPELLVTANASEAHELLNGLSTEALESLARGVKAPGDN